jgi:hypothetical protein
MHFVGKYKENMAKTTALKVRCMPEPQTKLRIIRPILKIYRPTVIWALKSSGDEFELKEIGIIK